VNLLSQIASGTGSRRKQMQKDCYKKGEVVVKSFVLALFFFMVMAVAENFLPPTVRIGYWFLFVHLRAALRPRCTNYNLHFPLPFGQSVLWISKRKALSFIKS
jgi:hypothetical protein